MKISNLPFDLVKWDTIKPTEHQGTKGKAIWRTAERGEIRLRMVRYDRGYVGEWCGRGHILLVLRGKLDVELKNGRKYTLEPGTSFQVGQEEANPHLASSHDGAEVFIID